jgi:hypothetical protein
MDVAEVASAAAALPVVTAVQADQPRRERELGDPPRARRRSPHGGHARRRRARPGAVVVQRTGGHGEGLGRAGVQDAGAGARRLSCARLRLARALASLVDRELHPLRVRADLHHPRDGVRTRRGVQAQRDLDDLCARRAEQRPHPGEREREPRRDHVGATEHEAGAGEEHRSAERRGEDRRALP